MSQCPHLDRNHRQICLIRLTNSKPEPSNPGYCWRFETKHASLDGPDLPPFTAFSYLWGKPKPGFHRVMVHGRFLDITPNLAAAIECLLKMEDVSGQWLWIDAVCIDQKDLDERAFQVALMRDVYARASRTIAYLGPEGEAGGLGVGLCWLEELGRAWTHPNRVEWLEGAATSDRHDTEWKTLSAVFDREWWHRAWILQETITSRNMHFAFGRIMISCEALENALLLLRAATPTAGLALMAKGVWMDGDRSGRFNAIYKRFHLRQWHHHHGRLSLGSIVSQRYHFFASDPRDYVYALFALVEGTGSRIASPDYAVETWEAYAGFVKKYVEAYGNLDVLCMATSPRQLQGLPSWAPDLTYCNGPGRTFVHEDGLWLMNLDAEEALKKERGGLNKPKATYCAAGTSSTNAIFSPDLRVLTSRAVFIDSVDGLSSHRHLVSPPPGTDFIQVGSTMPDVQPLRTTSSYGTQAKTCEALCRTLLLDRVPEFQTEPAPNYATFLLAYGFARAEAGRGDWALTELWKTMREFRVAGRPLHEWMRGDVSSTAMEETARRAAEEHMRRTESLSYPRERFEAPVVSSCVHKYVEMQRHLFVTEGGHVGAAPLGTQRGDEVWVLFGCNVPQVLRRSSSGGRYRVVGECYVHGFMYGEAMVDLESGKRKECMIELE